MARYYIGAISTDSGKQYKQVMKKRKAAESDNLEGIIQDLKVGMDGYIYVCGGKTPTIKRLHPETLKNEASSQNPSIGGSPLFIEIGLVSSVYSGQSSSVVKLDCKTLKEEAAIPITDQHNTAMTIGSDGFLYVGGQKGIVKKLNPETLEILAESGNISPVKSIATGKDGSIYAGTSNGIVKKLNPETLQVEVESRKYSNSVDALTIDTKGYIYIAIYNDTTIKKLDSQTLQEKSVSNPHTSNIQRNGMIAGLDGSIYVGSGSTVRKYEHKTLQEEESKNYGEDIYALAMGLDGSIYIGGASGIIKNDFIPYQIVDYEPVWG